MSSEEQPPVHVTASYAAAMERTDRTIADDPNPAIQQFMAAARRHIEKPLGGEPSSRAFWQAVVEFPADTILTDIIKGAMETRSGMPYGLTTGNLESSTPEGDMRRRVYKRILKEEIVDDELLGIFRTSVIDTARTLNPHLRDDSLVQPSDWRMPLEAFCSVAESTRGDRVNLQQTANLNVRKVSTSLPDRYVPLEIILQAMRERWPAGIRVLEIGSGVMVGAKQLLHKNQFPMSIDSVVDHMDGEQLTPHANRLLALPSFINQYVCVDVEKVLYEDPFRREEYVPGVVEWSISSLRSSERNNPAFMKKYRGLIDIQDPAIRFEYFNILRKEHAEEFKAKYPQPFDVVLKPTVTHQLKADGSRTLDGVLGQLAAPDAFIIEQDFMYLNPNSRGEPVPLSARRIKKEWTEPYSYSTNIVDLAQEEVGLQKVFDFKDNSRCRRARLHLAHVALNGQLWPLEDLIKHQS